MTIDSGFPQLALCLADEVWQSVLTHLRVIDLLNLRLTCQAMNAVVRSARVTRINATKAFDPRTIKLPPPTSILQDMAYMKSAALCADRDTLDKSRIASTDHLTEQLLDMKLAVDARTPIRTFCQFDPGYDRRRQNFEWPRDESKYRYYVDLKQIYQPYFSKINWTNIVGNLSVGPNLLELRLDGTGVDSLTACNLLRRTGDDLRKMQLLSLRFCEKVHAQALVDCMLEWSVLGNGRKTSLRKLYVLGIQGIPLREPDEGREYDELSTWHEKVHAFDSALSGLPSTHGKQILLDAWPCEDNEMCQAGLSDRAELADASDRLPRVLCDDHLPTDRGFPKGARLCRACLEVRACPMCLTIACPVCWNDELLSASQRHLDGVSSRRSLQHGLCFGPCKASDKLSSPAAQASATSSPEVSPSKTKRSMKAKTNVPNTSSSPISSPGGQQCLKTTSTRPNKKTRIEDVPDSRTPEFANQTDLGEMGSTNSKDKGKAKIYETPTSDVKILSDIDRFLVVMHQYFKFDWLDG